MKAKAMKLRSEVVVLGELVVSLEARRTVQKRAVLRENAPPLKGVGEDSFVVLWVVVEYS